MSLQLLMIERHFVLKGCRGTNKIAISLWFLSNRIAFRARGSTVRKTIQKQNPEFHPTFDDRDACGAREAMQNHRRATIAISLQFPRIETHFVGKSWPNTNPHWNFTSNFHHRHFVPEGCVSRTSINAALPPREKILKNFWNCRCLEQVDLHLHLYICHFAPAYTHFFCSSFWRSQSPPAPTYLPPHTPAYINSVVVLNRFLCACIYAPAPKHLHVRLCKQIILVYMRKIMRTCICKQLKLWNNESEDVEEDFLILIMMLMLLLLMMMMIRACLVKKKKEIVTMMIMMMMLMMMMVMMMMIMMTMVLRWCCCCDSVVMMVMREDGYGYGETTIMTKYAGNNLLGKPFASRFGDC